MKKKKFNLVRKTKVLQSNLADFLEMPPEILLDLPKVILIGNQELLIQNHRGIIEYHDRKVRVSVSLGQIIIDGEGLFLKNLKTDEISVEGKIIKITLEG